MPYYPDVADAPQNSIIGGASLWVMGGKKPEEYKGVAKFFTFLSDTDRQVGCTRNPATCRSPRRPTRRPRRPASTRRTRPRSAADQELTNKEPTENSRGLRLGNMVQLRDVWAEEIEAALAGRSRPSRLWTKPSRVAMPCCGRLKRRQNKGTWEFRHCE